MIDFLRFVGRLALVATAFSAVPINGIAAPDAPISSNGEFAAIASSFDSWRRSVVNVSLKYELVTTTKLNQDDRKVSRIVEWLWTDTGQRRTHVQFKTDGILADRVLDLVDRGRHAHVVYERGQSAYESPVRVTIFPPRTSPLVIEPLYCFWINLSDEWLPDAFAQGRATFAGHDTIDGVDCPRLIVEAQPGHFDVVVLDPAHGYLPRIAAAGRESNGLFRLEVVEFKKLDDLIWFPYSGRFLTRSDPLYRLPDRDGPITTDWRMLQVDLNRPIPEDALAFPASATTFVVDGFSGEAYYHGQSTLRSQLEAERIAQAEAMRSGQTAQGALTSAVSVVHPPSYRRTTITLLSLSAIFLFTGAIRAWKRGA